MPGGRDGKGYGITECLLPDKPYVTLEHPDVGEYAAAAGRGFLAGYRDGAVFDEVQRAPDLLS